MAYTILCELEGGVAGNSSDNLYFQQMSHFDFRRITVISFSLEMTLPSEIDKSSLKRQGRGKILSDYYQIYAKWAQIHYFTKINKISPNFSIRITHQLGHFVHALHASNSSERCSIFNGTDTSRRFNSWLKCEEENNTKHPNLTHQIIQYT